MKQYIQYIIILILAVNTTACEDFLNREPQNEVSKDQIFSDIEGAEMAINGVYYTLSNSAYFYRENFLLFAELRGGNIKYGDIESGTKNSWLPSYEFTSDGDDTGDDDMYSTYKYMYELLYTINSVVEGVIILEDGTEEQRNQILAEALTLRALTHFDLTKFFAQPYAATANGTHLGVVTLDKTIDITTFPSRSALYQTYEQITEDLETAVELYSGFRVPTNGTSDFEARAFATKEAAEALLARVYLYQNDWNNAVIWSTKVINNSSISLLSNSNYVKEWESYNVTTSEDIFVLSMDQAQAQSISKAYGYDTDNSFEDRESDFSFTSDLLSLYNDGDVRKDLFSENGNGDIVTRKYSATGLREEMRVLIRLSEVYLIRAEAAARNGDVVTARTDLETIRYRANPNAEPVLLSGQDLIDEILVEKRRELVGEGHLFFDIARTTTNLQRDDFNGVDNQNISALDYRMILPIPQDAMDNNERLVQNAGY